MKRFGRKDNEIDQLRKMNLESQEEYKNSDVYDMSSDNKSELKESLKGKLPNKTKSASIIWVLIVLLLPPPFGFLLLKLCNRKLKFYHYLLIFNILGILFVFFINSMVFTPLQMQISAYNNMRRLRVIKPKTDIDYGFETNPDGTVTFTPSPSSSNPTYNGGLEIDYDKLDELEKQQPGSRKRAQRYQLYSQLANMFDSDPLLLYGVTFVESSCELNLTDIYQEYVSTGESSTKHSIGPYQVSSSPKHLAHAFESQYSTRVGSPKDNSVMSIQQGMNFSDALKRQANFPSNKLPSNHTIIDIKNGYSLTGREAELANNIKEPSSSTGAFFNRRLQTGDTTYNNSYGTTYHLRPNPFYFPDGSYSQIFDIYWITKQLDEAVNEMKNTGTGKLSIGNNSDGDWTLKWDKESIDRYLNSTNAQRMEIAFMYYCDWYLGTLAVHSKGSSAVTARKKLGEFGIKIQKKYDSICLKQPMNSNEVWLRVDGRVGHGAVTNKGGSLVYEMGYWDIYESIGGGGGGSKNWEAFTYAVRGMNGGYKVMLEDKVIFDKVRATNSNSNGSGGSTQKAKIIELQWSEAHTMFPRYDNGGPTLMTLIDVRTGKTFKVYRTVGTNHADVEPATLEDAKIIKSTRGGQWTWERRPTLVVGEGNKMYACSLAGYPHGGRDDLPFSPSNLDFIKNNGTDGVLDLHFRGSKTHAEGDIPEKVDQEHQKAIDEALKSSQNSLNNEDGPLIGNGEIYPPMLKYTSITQGFHSGHKGVDVQYLPFVDNMNSVQSNGYTFTSSVKPTTKLYAVMDGTVERVKCHYPAKTGNPLPNDPEQSDFSKGPINHKLPAHGEGGKTIVPDAYEYAEGDCVYIRGVDGNLYLYMHMFCGSVQVKEGQKVHKGQCIGYQGNSGRCQSSGGTGAHLHFQVNIPGNINPKWIVELGTKVSPGK